MGTVC